MLKRKIKSVLSIMTLAAFLSVQIGCAAKNKDQDNVIRSGRDEVVVDKDRMQLEYSTAYENFCRLSESVENNDVKRYAAEMTENLSEIRRQFDEEFEDTHEIIDSLDNNVVNDRQRSYENEIRERLDAAENAALQLSQNNFADEESLEILSELFSEKEADFIPTAVPSLTTDRKSVV